MSGSSRPRSPILALKSSVHFRADFAPIARAIIVAAAPGPVVADPATLAVPARSPRRAAAAEPLGRHDPATAKVISWQHWIPGNAPPIFVVIGS